MSEIQPMPTVGPAAAAFDPRGNVEFARDPYPVFNALRTEAPVVYLPAIGHYWAVSHEATEAVLRDNRLGHPPGGNSMVFVNPPDHTRLRGLVAKAFTPKVTESMRPHIERLVTGMLDRMEAQGGGDLMTELAFPLPATVIAEMLGVPEEDHEQFRAWSNAITMGMDIGVGTDHRVEGASVQANNEIAQYFMVMAQQRKAAPKDDLITKLMVAQEEGDRLSPGEMIGTCILLLIAGHETTTNLLGNGTLALLQNPEQLALLRSKPELLESAVEEMLRYDSPVQRMGRRVLTEGVEICGVALPKDAQVLAVIGAANRDPAVFSSPDVLDITRDPNPHLSFGKGIHYCLGASLARMEAEIAFTMMLERFPNLRLAGEPVRSPATRFRSLRSLPLAF